MKSEVFLDSVYAIALSAASDEHHHRALDLAKRLKAAGTRFVTTHAILLEIGNTLAKARYRRAAVALLRSLIADPFVEIVALTPELFSRAFRLYADRMDKQWGLTDCVSFVVMRNRGITEALTADEHFRQAGFVALRAETSQ